MPSGNEHAPQRLALRIKRNAVASMPTVARQLRRLFSFPGEYLL